MRINPELNKGDKIILLSMDDEYGVSPFTKGVVTSISNTPFGIQYTVSWENGSKLDLIPDADKWVLESDFSERRKKVTNLKESSNIDWFLENEYLREHFNTKLISKFLTLVKKSGITNMFGAAPYLYMGKDRIEHEFKYKNINNEDSFEELLEIADEVRSNIISGTISYLEEKKGDNYELGTIQRYAERLSTKLLEYWIKTHG